MRRFESMESRVHERGQNLDQLALEEMDRLWDEAKAAEAGTAGSADRPSLGHQGRPNEP